MVKKLHNTRSLVEYGKLSGSLCGINTMQPQVEHMLEKLEQLSPDRLAEVEDFIDFLQQRDQDRALRRDFAYASEGTLSKIWINDDDAIYDAL